MKTALNLIGITEFKYERKNEKDSGRSSRMTPSCKWSIESSLSKWGQEQNLSGKEKKFLKKTSYQRLSTETRFGRG